MLATIDQKLFTKEKICDIPYVSIVIAIREKTFSQI